MVADAEVGVGLHRVRCELAEPGPGVEVAGPTSRDRGDRGASLLGIGLLERGFQRCDLLVGHGWQHRLGWALVAEVHGA